MSGASFGLAFSAGLVASLNPCAFAMLPAFAAYYLGLGDEREQPGILVRLARGLVVGTAMSAGFLVVFAGIGVVVSLAGSRLLRYQDVVGLVIGIALGAIGAWLVSGRELRVFVPNPVRGRGRGGRDLVSASVYGVGYGLASLACTLPIFLVVVGTAFTNGSVLGGFELFLAYSLGMGAIVVAVTLGAALFKSVVAQVLRKAMPFVQRASGALLILAGTYIAVRQLSEAQLGTLAALQPHATEIGAALAVASVVAAAALWWFGGEAEPAVAPERESEPERASRQAELAASRRS